MSDDKIVVHLNAKRRPVNYTVSITQHWDGRIEAWVHDVADDPRSRAAVADCLDRLAAHWCEQSRKPDDEAPEWDAIDGINAWGRVTSELGLPWGASASRVIEAIRERAEVARKEARDE